MLDCGYVLPWQRDEGMLDCQVRLEVELVRTGMRRGMTKEEIARQAALITRDPIEASTPPSADAVFGRRTCIFHPHTREDDSDEELIPEAADDPALLIPREIDETHDDPGDEETRAHTARQAVKRADREMLVGEEEFWGPFGEVVSTGDVCADRGRGSHAGTSSRERRGGSPVEVTITFPGDLAGGGATVGNTSGGGDDTSGDGGRDGHSRGGRDSSSSNNNSVGGGGSNSGGGGGTSGGSGGDSSCRHRGTAGGAAAVEGEVATAMQEEEALSAVAVEGEVAGPVEEEITAAAEVPHRGGDKRLMQQFLMEELDPVIAGMTLGVARGLGISDSEMGTHIDFDLSTGLPPSCGGATSTDRAPSRDEAAGETLTQTPRERTTTESPDAARDIIGRERARLMTSNDPRAQALARALEERKSRGTGRDVVGRDVGDTALYGRTDIDLDSTRPVTEHTARLQSGLGHRGARTPAAREVAAAPCEPHRGRGIGLSNSALDQALRAVTRVVHEQTPRKRGVTPRPRPLPAQGGAALGESSRAEGLGMPRGSRRLQTVGKASARVVVLRKGGDPVTVEEGDPKTGPPAHAVREDDEDYEGEEEGEEEESESHDSVTDDDNEDESPPPPPTRALRRSSAPTSSSAGRRGRSTSDTRGGTRSRRRRSEKGKRRARSGVYHYLVVDQKVDNKGVMMLCCTFWNKVFQRTQFQATRHFIQTNYCKDISDEALYEIARRAQQKFESDQMERVARYAAERGLNVLDTSAARGGEAGRRPVEGGVGGDGGHDAPDHPLGVGGGDTKEGVIHVDREARGPGEEGVPGHKDVLGPDFYPGTGQRMEDWLRRAGKGSATEGSSKRKEGGTDSAATRAGKRLREHKVLEVYGGEWVARHKKTFLRWLYSSGVSFNAFRNQAWKAYQQVLLEQPGSSPRTMLPNHSEIASMRAMETHRAELAEELEESCASLVERNWDVHEGIHTKKRNQLAFKKVVQLVDFTTNVRLAEYRRAGCGYVLPWQRDEGMLNCQAGLEVEPVRTGTGRGMTEEEIARQVALITWDPIGASAPPSADAVLGTSSTEARVTTPTPTERESSMLPPSAPSPTPPSPVSPLQPYMAATDTEELASSLPQHVLLRRGGAVLQPRLRSPSPEILHEEGPPSATPVEGEMAPAAVADATVAAVVDEIAATAAAAVLEEVAAAVVEEEAPTATVEGITAVVIEEIAAARGAATMEGEVAAEVEEEETPSATAVEGEVVVPVQEEIAAAAEVPHGRGDERLMQHLLTEELDPVIAGMTPGVARGLGISDSEMGTHIDFDLSMGLPPSCGAATSTDRALLRDEVAGETSTQTPRERTTTKSPDATRDIMERERARLMASSNPRAQAFARALEERRSRQTGRDGGQGGAVVGEDAR
ncbi:hypothetical protein CBR_g49871 [Chara braunii]|uniref:Uncharacterized protein n=1 Tax=Chara braunii TaxID=69332 RepID=A0A388JPA4_CHABU|nr:hypothetical protein CBR_g49871 [Chara braunii]|eukprot:GBG59607.1 hypothetical protein CBR_g49871 [Chara braunii]